MRKRNSMYQSVPLSDSMVSALPRALPLPALESTIKTPSHLHNHSICPCYLCLKALQTTPKSTYNVQQPVSPLETAAKFKQILDGLTPLSVPGLKIMLPWLFFLSSDGLQVYGNRRDGRLEKWPGFTPLKQLYPSMVRLRQQYKSHLQHIFNTKISSNKVDPQFLHMKYYDKVVPSSFHQGMTSDILQGNKHQFRKYVLHKNDQYEIASLQEHKMNQKEPFCLGMHCDGNLQLMNQIQFQNTVLNTNHHLTQQWICFMSYIKYKQEGQGILFSEFTYDLSSLDADLDSRAEADIMVQIGGLHKYEPGFRDMATIEQLQSQLMADSCQEYVNYMTYKMVHFLAMASKVHLAKLKLKWFINDIGQIYLQQVMQAHMVDQHNPNRRPVKYYLPAAADNQQFYQGKAQFLDIYKEMKQRRQLNTLIVRKDLHHKSYEETLQYMNPEMRSLYDQNKVKEETDRKAKRKAVLGAALPQHRRHSSLYRNLQQSKPTQVSRGRCMMLNSPSFRPSVPSARYQSLSQSPSRLQSNFAAHFKYNQSAQDRKASLNFSEGPNPYQAYLQSERQKISKSVLYSTFNQLSKRKMREIGSVLQQQRLSRKLQQNSCHSTIDH